MKVVSVIYNDIDILPCFLRHYAALGATGFIIGVYTDAGLMTSAREVANGYDVTFFPIDGAYGSNKDIHFEFDACQRLIGRDEWWIIADVDEFHEYPSSLGDIIEELEADNALYLCSNLVERITADGSCPPLKPSYPIWAQFPAAAAIRRLTGTCSSKVMLVKGHRRFSGGHHRVEPNLGRRARWMGHVHHFKWHGRAIERLIAQIECVKKQGWVYYKTLQRFLDFWDAHQRMPIAGELGFYYPRKPSTWPD